MSFYQRAALWPCRSVWRPLRFGYRLLPTILTQSPDWQTELLAALPKLMPPECRKNIINIQCSEHTTSVYRLTSVSNQLPKNCKPDIEPPLACPKIQKFYWSAGRGWAPEMLMIKFWRPRQGFLSGSQIYTSYT